MTVFILGRKQEQSLWPSPLGGPPPAGVSSRRHSLWFQLGAWQHQAVTPKVEEAAPEGLGIGWDSEAKKTKAFSRSAGEGAAAWACPLPTSAGSGPSPGSQGAHCLGRKCAHSAHCCLVFSVKRYHSWTHWALVSEITGPALQSLQNHSKLPKKAVSVSGLCKH